MPVSTIASSRSVFIDTLAAFPPAHATYTFVESSENWNEKARTINGQNCQPIPPAVR